MSAPTSPPGGRPLPPEAAVPFEEGLRRWAAGDPEGAHVCFTAAHRRAPGDPRIQSWYGLTLVTVERNSNLGVVLVDRAARIPRPEPELLLNQSRVAMALGQRVRAVQALDRGLGLYPGEPTLLEARLAMGVRKRPVVPFLSRDNPLNRVLGRLTHRWRKPGPGDDGPGTEPGSPR